MDVADDAADKNHSANKGTGGLDDEADDDGCNDAGQIADEVEDAPSQAD